MKRTKIICTIGPASEKPEILNSMIKSGMNIARLNFSHGTHGNHKALIKNIRAAAKRNKRAVGILADLQGPKIRLGDLKEPVDIKTGDKLILTTHSSSFGLRRAGLTKFPVTYANLHRDVKKGQRILIDDGLLELLVSVVKGKDIICKVINGGKLTSHKGINLPDSKVRLSSLTKKDKEDLFFAMGQGVDFVAISFVRSAKDIKELIGLLNKNSKELKSKKPRIIAKIEKGEALENFLEILKLADAIMVARGDLAVETPAENVPLRQKEIIALCRQAAKPVIVATQMLDSMIRNPRPTRAEVSDVANAVMANVDAVMLSGESASGLYPAEAVKMMNKIILETEASPYDDVEAQLDCDPKTKEGIGERVAVLIREKNIKQIVDLSGGDTFRYISKWRPEADVFVKTNGQDLYPYLFWGVRPFVFNNESAKSALSFLRKNKILKSRKAILLSEKNEIEIID